MGEFKLGIVGSTFGWIVSAVLICINLYSIHTFDFDTMTWVIVGIVTVFYFTFIIIILTAKTRELLPAYEVKHNDSCFE